MNKDINNRGRPANFGVGGKDAEAATPSGGNPAAFAHPNVPPAFVCPRCGRGTTLRNRSLDGADCHGLCRFCGKSVVLTLGGSTYGVVRAGR